MENKDEMSLEERANQFAHLLLELGYVLDEFQPDDPDFDDQEFLEKQRKDFIEKYGNKS